MDEWPDAETRERRLERLRSAIADLDAPDERLAVLFVVERRARDVAEFDGQHPLLAEADRQMAAFKARHPEQFGELPPLRPIGRIDDACPTCLTPTSPRPKRQTRCKACGAAIYVRTRPLDGMVVLLKDADLPLLNEDWLIDYKIKQRRPRQPSPEWQRRIEEAMTAGPRSDPTVEREAQRVFAAQLKACAAGEAPRTALDALLATVSTERREAVEHRVWQLQIQSLHGGVSLTA